MLSRFIDQLSKEMGWNEPVSQQDDGSFQLFFEPDINITLNNTVDGKISFFSKLALLPKDKTQDFLLKLMKANLLGKETGGSMLGIDKSETHVLLLHFLWNDPSYKTFRESLEDFINYADVWKDETKLFSPVGGLK